MLYNIVLVQQCESVLNIHISPLEPLFQSPVTSLGFIIEHWAEFPVLLIYICLWLAIYFALDAIYMSTLLSQRVPSSTSSAVPHVHSLHLHLYSCPANRFIVPFFLDSIHKCDMFFSFWLPSLCITGSRFIHLTITDSNSFLFMASHIPLYICTTAALSVQLSMDI